VSRCTLTTEQRDRHPALACHPVISTPWPQNGNEIVATLAVFAAIVATFAAYLPRIGNGNPGKAA